MPNPGGMYLGCQKCRQRKIKCDRASPTCKRCTIHGVPCPGYPQTRDVIFRHETVKTVRKASAGSFSEDPAALDKQTSTDTLNDAKKRLFSLPVPSSLRLSDTVISTCYFMHQLVIPVGWFPLIPQLYQVSESGGCLKWAVDAASMFLYANRTGNDQLVVPARTLYSSALNATNIAISDPVERLKDETFCAILILNIIDDITGDMSFVSGTHVDGCRELLIQREASSFTSYAASDLVLSVVIQTQPQILRNYQIPPPGSLQWLSKQHSGTLAAIILAECINVQQLRFSSFDLLSRSLNIFPEDLSSWMGILNAAERIDIRLAQLAPQFGGRWGIIRHVSLRKPTALDYYHDIQVAKVWNQQRSTRIALNEFLLEICDGFQIPHRVRNNIDLEILRRRSIEVITSMSSAICASIPFHLGKVDANGRKCSSDAQQVAGACALIWPLETVAKCRYNGEDHRLIARATLEEIGQAVGVRQAARKLSELSDRDSNSLSSEIREDLSFPGSRVATRSLS